MAKIEIDGYHGTTQECATQIVSVQDFVDSKKDNEWLGTGVYFFAYKAHADWWTGHHRYHNIETCVLKAHLMFTDDQYLDLDDPNRLNFLETFVAKALEITNDSGEKNIRVNIKELGLYEKLNFACNLLRSFFPQFGIISYTFSTSCKPGITGFKQNQRQICVSDHSIIGKIEIV